MADMLNYFNLFDEKLKVKKLKHARNYMEVGTNLLTQMFDYTNMYDGFFENIFEFFLIRWGIVMTFVDNGHVISCPASPVGLPNDNGEYETFIGHTLNGKVFTKKNHVDCVICYNTTLGTPDRFIDFFAEILTEIDTSLNLAVINSRNIPLPVGKDSKSIESIKEALKSIKEGREAYILDKNMLDEIETGVKSLEVLNISDVSTADKIQYLSKTHDDLLRRILTLYGHNQNGSPKQAQMTEKEISSSESYSFIYPIMRRKLRIQWLDECKDLFPEFFPADASVEFSTTWYVQYKAFIEENMDENIKENLDENIEEKEGEKDESAEV